MIHLTVGAGFRHPGLSEHMWYVFTLTARGDLRSGMGAYFNGEVRDALSFMERHLQPDRPGLGLAVIPALRRARRYVVRTAQSETCDGHPAEQAALSSVPVPDDSCP